jgi:hypothetical protein
VPEQQCLVGADLVPQHLDLRWILLVSFAQ